MSRFRLSASVVAFAVGLGAISFANAQEEAPAAKAKGAQAPAAEKAGSDEADDSELQATSKSSRGFASVLGDKKGARLPCPVSDPAEVELLLALRERHTVLLAREAQLAQREAMLKQFEAALASRLAQVEVALSKVEHSLSLGKAGEKDRETRLQALTDTVSKLSAKKAAPMLAQADPSLVAELFRRLGPMRVSALLAVMPPAKAGKLLDSAAQHETAAGEGNASAAGGTP